MLHITASDVRNHFADTINRVSYGGERLVLDRNGKSIAAIIPFEDLQLLRELEDRIDLAAFRAARNEESIPLDQLKAELGL